MKQPEQELRPNKQEREQEMPKKEPDERRQQQNKRKL